MKMANVIVPQRREYETLKTHKQITPIEIQKNI